MKRILAAIAIILVVYYFGSAYKVDKSEHYLPCSDCTTQLAHTNQYALNPFVYPYSGTEAINDMYRQNKAGTLTMDFAVNKSVQNRFTPDHVLLTN